MKNSQHKRSKMGQLPGDSSRWTKIRMMEHDVPIQIFPWQIISVEVAKSFRKCQHRRAEKKWRQRERKDIDEQLR